MDKQQSYWQKIAKHHTASRHLYKVDVIVHTEDTDDIAFWQAAIAHVRPDKKVKFVSSDNNLRGQRVTGKSNCLKYIPYLNQHFMLCIDSDFDYLQDDKQINGNDYVIQTYTYSWENHYCYGSGLQEKWKENYETDFCFSDFLARLNPILYEALIKLLIAKITKCGQLTLDALCSAILGVQLNKGRLENNGKEYVSRIAAAIDKWGENTVFDDEKIKTAKAHYAKAGMNDGNAYLYMQGHCIYDMLLRMGNFLTDNAIDFKNQVLAQTLTFDGYNEIKSVQSHLAKALV